MSELLDLLDLGPMIAIAVACVLMVAVVVVVLLQARRIARLERALADRGESADEASLQRIAELQARQEASEGIRSPGSSMRTAFTVGAGVLVLLLAIGGVWLFATGGDDGGTGAEAATGTTAGSTREAPARPATSPVSATALPASIPPLEDTSQFTVKVYNASGVAGAAGDGVAPRLDTEGYDILVPDNYPNGETGLARSLVMYNGKKNQPAAWNIADVLGIKRAPPLEGLTVDQIGGADVVVVVGLDLAENVVATNTP